MRTLHYAQADAAPPFKPVEGTEGELKADLVLLAMGFLHPEQDLLDALGVAKDGAATPRRSSRTRPPSRASSPPATRAAASR